jgi:hypothetical protein
MSNILSDYYATPPFSPDVYSYAGRKDGAGFFRIGADVVCYGECSSGVASTVQGAADFDALKAVRVTGSELRLPFEISDVIENLRKEYYVRGLNSGRKKLTRHASIRNSYYFVREMLPVWFRRHLQRTFLKDWQDLAFPQWPVDFTADLLHETFLRLMMRAHGCDKVPFIWFWPDGAASCTIMTHDVETAAGRDFSSSLMDIDRSHGFRASLQVVPEKRYKVPESYVNEIRTRGFEFNIHDLNHDGRLFDEKDEFLRRAKKINGYVKRYNARGFRAGAMYRNLDWFDAFEFSYDMSVPNVAHLEPQRGGCCTVMPFFVGKILEIPLTTVQDYALFHILNHYTIDLWKRQIDLIRQRNGLVSFIAHPDYLINRRGRRVYESLLDHLRQTVDREHMWSTVTEELDQWWRSRRAMELVQRGGEWRIVGAESERARIAYATLDGDRIVYTLDTNSPGIAGA